LAALELYGDEKRLIVQNLTKGVIVITFGPNGRDGSYTIPRTTMPVVLTPDVRPREDWIRSNDFRAAVTKGAIRIVSDEEYDRVMAAHRAKEEAMRKLAAMDRATPRKVETQDGPASVIVDDPVDAPPTPAVLADDEATAVPASQADVARVANLDPNAVADMVRRYEQSLDAEINTRPLADGSTARLDAFVTAMARGDLQPLEAMRKLDEDAVFYSDDQLRTIAGRSPYKAVAVLAEELIASRQGPEAEFRK
jgi:hypothetical protein